MTELMTLEQMVRDALTECPATRDDDRLLCLYVWTKNFQISYNAPISKVMKATWLPSQESLGRVRRKIQQTDETLRGSKGKEKIRLNAQVDYTEYAKTDL